MKWSSTQKRSIGPISLMFTGLGSIIGSGWLFGAWHTAKIAGPAAILAWLIGAVVILAIALTYVELGAMFPESGGNGALRPLLRVTAKPHSPAAERSLRARSMYPGGCPYVFRQALGAVCGW